MDKIYLSEVDKIHPVEMQDGLLLRRTMSYNNDIMLCHFTLKKGLVLPLHQHKNVQIGYVLKGKVKFSKGDDSFFIAEPGTSYVFDSNEIHGIDEVLEECEFIECFSPIRLEYT
ncbi:MAG: cupin domain-containing protein [Clostridiales bacterium]